MTMTVDVAATDDNLPPPPAKRGWTVMRCMGWFFVVLWILILGTMAWYLWSQWKWPVIEKWGPAYFSGLWKTLKLTAAAIFYGALLSFPITWARMSGNRITSKIAYAYVYFFRGTPLLAQVFLIYYGLPILLRPFLESIGLWGWLKDGWPWAILAFSLNSAAYQAEILRGAIQSVPRGQWEGAASLGLHKAQTLWKVILPQAMVVGLRPYGNEVILTIKASAVVSLVTILDIMGQAKLAVSETLDSFQAYLWAGVFYLVIVEILRHIVEWTERRLTRHITH